MEKKKGYRFLTLNWRGKERCRGVRMLAGKKKRRPLRPLLTELKEQKEIPDPRSGERKRAGSPR